ncbi:CaiB/BaiF CoA transferase family protein [Miltoncostaea marina]|uniref:CaiB/BaiF CoA transferase family protein n=1 Tax=Miltoncostaea marina TaxID=2843215 RepID=UPI001C3E4AD3|nr:CoA transferase [Miltoncostaea marina]
MGPPPLTGLRVLDCSHNLAGPLTAMHLGDLGAEVIKVERPSGDEWRDHERIPGRPGMSRHYAQANRNKRAVCLDLATDDGRAVVRQLVARADVLVTNMRPGVPEKLGFGWEDARRLNPGLVYCEISAFGREGPRGGRPGYDLLGEALAGFMPPGWATPGSPPTGSPVPINDTALPLLASTGILAALIERGRTGRGQRVEASILGSAVALNAHSLVRIESLPQHGTPTFSRAFYRAYATRDGWIAVAAYAERLARRFCEAVGRPGLLDAPPWDDRAARVTRAEELVAEFAPTLRERTTAEWDEAFAAHGVPAVPVQERDELFDDPQARAEGLLAEIDDHELGRLTMTAPVVKLSDTPGAIRFAGRRLGADTREVLAELGHDDAEIERLLAAGVAVAAT